jgi:hypothetical protein
MQVYPSSLPDIPEYNITKIARLNADKRIELLKAGIIDIKDVPRISVERETAKAVLTSPSVPNRTSTPQLSTRCSLDCSTRSLPRLRKFQLRDSALRSIRPYQQMLFQYSLPHHRSPGRRADANRFRSHVQTSCIRHANSRRLYADLSESIGTSSFGTKPLRRCAPPSSHCSIRSLRFSQDDQCIDLRSHDVFSKGHYMHPGFPRELVDQEVLPSSAPSSL